MAIRVLRRRNGIGSPALPRLEHEHPCSDSPQTSEAGASSGSSRSTCPGRHQPGTGEINYRFVLDAIDRAGFDGWVCPEYVPLGGTEDSLGWLRDWGYWANTW